MTVRILIVDDHGVLRAGLRALLNGESEFQVVGEAANGEEALRLAKQTRPDIVLQDMGLPDLDGLEVTRRLKASLPDTHVLILTLHEDGSLLREAIRAGAAGYIIKRAAESELINALRAVARGELYVHPAMTRALLNDSLDSPMSSHADAEALTAREKEVILLIAQGYTNRQIGDSLNISIRTVETHRANATSKLGLNSRVDLVRYVTSHGWRDDKTAH